MSVKERILALKLLESQKRNAEFLEKIGVKVQMEQKTELVTKQNDNVFLKRKGGLL